MLERAFTSLHILNDVFLLSFSSSGIATIASHCSNTQADVNAQMLQDTAKAATARKVVPNLVDAIQDGTRILGEAERRHQLVRCAAVIELVAKLQNDI